MSNAPLMPKATAVWLVDNTALTFDQVADFTKMHPLEIRAIADGDAAQGIKGMDPISTGQLTRDEIEKGEKDKNYRLKLEESKVILPPAAKKKGPRYTPVSRRHERPSAILWLVRNHAELKDAQIMRLVGTTKTTIASVRDRTHWNASTLTPMDPVTLGLCSQIELDFEVQRAAKEKPVPAAYGGATLLPASETTKKEPEFETSEKTEDDLNVDAVFAKLKTIGGKRQDRPNAILWLVRNHPELKDAQIMRLVGTTKSTIAGIRERTHWNAAQLQPLDPVTLGLCTQIDLDFEVQRAAKEKPVIEDRGATLLPAAVTTAAAEAKVEAEQGGKKQGDDLDVSTVFAKLKQLGGKQDE